VCGSNDPALLYCAPDSRWLLPIGRFIVHTHTMRHLAATCLLSLSLTTPALADDWRSQWREALPEAPVPADVFEAYREVWTWFVEAWAAEDTCTRVRHGISMQFLEEAKARRLEGLNAVLELSRSTLFMCAPLSIRAQVMSSVSSAIDRDLMAHDDFEKKISLAELQMRISHLKRIEKRQKEAMDITRSIDAQTEALNESLQTN